MLNNQKKVDSVGNKNFFIFLDTYTLLTVTIYYAIVQIMDNNNWNNRISRIYLIWKIPGEC